MFAGLRLFVLRTTLSDKEGDESTYYWRPKNEHVRMMPTHPRSAASNPTDIFLSACVFRSFLGRTV
jgi:hypothetical protein